MSATRKTAAKKTASSSTTTKSTETPKDEAATTTKPDTGETVVTDPNADASKAGQVDDEIKPEDIQFVQIVDGPVVNDTTEVDSEVVDTEFVYVHQLDPARRLPGGTYLDEVQRYEAEAARAMVEDREPDFKHAPATQGTPLRSLDILKSELPPVFENLESDSLKTVTLPVVVSK